MLKGEKLLCAMTDVDDCYIQSAYEYQQKGERIPLRSICILECMEPLRRRKSIRF